jgi:hypothetical protein
MLTANPVLVNSAAPEAGMVLMGGTWQCANQLIVHGEALNLG